MQTADRTKFIGGSDIAAILGISPWKTATDLWLDKTLPRVDQGDNAAAKRRGQRLEPYILDMIREEHGIKIIARNERYEDAEVPYFAAEIDAETDADENVELKTVHPFKARDWGELETDQLPMHYLAQVQWGLGVRRRQRCLVFALIGDDLRDYVVERDDETIAAMRSRAVDFWQVYVLRKIVPPFDYGDRRTLDTLRRMYPGTDGSTILASAEHEHWRAVMRTAEQARKRYEGVVDGARAHIMAEMGNAALLQFDDGKAFRRKQIERKGYTVQPSTYMDLRIINTKDEA